MKKFIGILAASLLVAGFVIVEQVEAQKIKGKTRAASTKHLMVGLVASNCGHLKKDLEASDIDWEHITMHASLLNEAGYLLMDDGRCPDSEWAKAAKALQTHSAAIVAASTKDDVAGAKAAFAELTAQSCAICHAAHRPKP